jgi:hypothetical protein
MSGYEELVGRLRDIHAGKPLDVACKLDDLCQEAATALEAAQGNLEFESNRADDMQADRDTWKSRFEAAQRENDRWKASALAARAQRDGLWDTLSWIDNFDPETTAAAEKKFGFDLSLRAFINEQT